MFVKQSQKNSRAENRHRHTFTKMHNHREAAEEQYVVLEPEEAATQMSPTVSVCARLMLAPSILCCSLLMLICIVFVHVLSLSHF